jgi:hypothetical protein
MAHQHDDSPDGDTIRLCDIVDEYGQDVADQAIEEYGCYSQRHGRSGEPFWLATQFEQIYPLMIERDRRDRGLIV